MDEKAMIQLIDSMMREHKANSHRDLGDVKEWCKYCLALSDLKRELERGKMEHQGNRKEVRPSPRYNNSIQDAHLRTKLAEIEERIEKLEGVTGLVVRCPECKSTNVKFLWTGPIGDRTPLSHEYYSVFDCENCGKRFTH